MLQDVNKQLNLIKIVEKYIIETDTSILLDNPGGNLKALNSFFITYAYQQ